MVRVRDALRVVRLCEELRDLPAVAAIRKQHAAGALCRLLGSQVGIINAGSDFRPGGNPRLQLGAAGGWLGQKEQGIFERYLRSPDHCVDPFLRPLSEINETWITRCRHDLVDDADWYGCAHVAEDRRGARVDDVIYSTLRQNDKGLIQIMAVHRPWGDPRKFNRRERALMNLIHRAIAPLLEPEPSPLAQRFSTLSPRLRETAEYLLTRLTEKEIASRMGLSPHTVHSYVKQIYVHVGVESRAELMAMSLQGSDKHRKGVL
jgi:DNA-binding CsgD family transcriptional regulator